VVVFHAFYSLESPPAAFEIPSFIPKLEREKSRELEQFVESRKHARPGELIINYRCLKKEDDQGGMPMPAHFHAVAVEKTTHESYAAHVTCVAKLGAVSEQLLFLTEAYGVDLIVMGMQGVGASLGRALIGSTTMAAMRNCRVPVLGVPPKTTFCDLKKVVFASDLRQQPDRLQLVKLRDFVSTFRSRLQVLHLAEEKELEAVQRKIQRALDALERELHDVDYQVILRQRKDTASDIQEYVQEHRIHLLILAPQQHSFLEKLFHRSVTSKMVAAGLFPLLTLPAPNTGDHPLAEEKVEKDQPR